MSTLTFIRAEQVREVAAVVRRAAGPAVSDPRLGEALYRPPLACFFLDDCAHLWPARCAWEKLRKRTHGGRAGAVTERLLRLDLEREE